MAKLPGIITRLNLPRQRTFQGPASIWKRVIAFLIDILFIDLVLLWPFESLFKRFMPEGYTGINSIRSMQEFFLTSPELTRLVTVATVAMGMLIVLYFTLMEYRLGQTIGKMLMKIRVVSEKNSGKDPVKPWQALLRSIIWLPMFPFIVFWVIDPLYVFLNQNSQRLLEYASRTRTVEDYRGI